METKKGIVQGFYRDQLLGVDSMAYFSFRKLRTILSSPQDFFQVYRPGAAREPATQAMDLGRLVHMGLLEQKKFRDRFVVMPKFVGKTKDGRDSEQSAEARAKRDAWMIEQTENDRVIVSEEERDTIIDSVEMVMNYEPARRLLTGGIAEGWGYVWDPIFGRFQLIRPDFISNDLVTVDVKTTTRALPSPRAWARQVFFDGNHVQLAHNARGVGLYRAGDDQKEVDRISRRGAWIVIKTSFPRGIAVYTANEQMMDAGLAKCFSAYHKINQFLDKDPTMTTRWAWPGKQQRAEEVSFEPWMLQDDEDYSEITQTNNP
jgi:hypothetical protein